MEIIKPEDYTDVVYKLIRGGKLQAVDSDVIYAMSKNQLRLFCHFYAVYQLVTTELVNFVKQEIGGNHAIEIGSGNGALGRALGIPCTDNRMQEDPAIMLYYMLGRQPVIKYGDDVEKLDAFQAINKHKPDVVVAAWVTQTWDEKLGKGNALGPDETLFKGKIKKYIFIGTDTVHADKKIFKLFPHKIYRFDWLHSRAADQKKNFIAVFDCR